MNEITVVICSADRIGVIDRVLLSLRSQTNVPSEVVYVKGPNAETPTVKGLNLIVVEFNERNLSKARNIGIKFSTQKFIVFLDDDVLCERHLIECYSNILNSATNENVVVGGYVRLGGTLNWQYQGFATDALGNTVERRNYSINGDQVFASVLGANFGVSKRLLESVNGFNHAYRWFLDETDLLRRISRSVKKIEILENACVTHWKASSTIRNKEGHYTSIINQWTSLGYFSASHGIADVSKYDVIRSLAWKARETYLNLDKAQISGLFDTSTIERLKRRSSKVWMSGSVKR